MGKRSRTKDAANALSAERIMDAAAARIDRDGLEAFSMRGLAQDLGVEAMSLYHWFPSKGHLLDGLLDRFVGRVVVPEVGAPRERLAVMARSFRASGRANPGLMYFVAIHRFNTRPALALLERTLAVLSEIRPDPAERAASFRLLIHWLVGFCMDECSGFSQGPGAQDPPGDEEVGAAYPRVVQLGPFNKPEHFDMLFEKGLAAILKAL
jgi:TetR/AcrR family tetracycline transcriptional repressor